MSPEDKAAAKDLAKLAESDSKKVGEAAEEGDDKKEGDAEEAKAEEAPKKEAPKALSQEVESLEDDDEKVEEAPKPKKVVHKALS